MYIHNNTQDISRETLSNFQAEPANYVYKKATYEPISVVSV